MENLIFRLGDATIVSSGELQNKIYANLKVSDVEVVLDGVDVNRYRNIFVLKEKAETVFIYSGAFVDNKGIGFLLEAILQVVKKKTEGFKFILAGGPAENIAGFISENGLSERVEIISPLNYIDLPEVNKRGDVAIDPKFSNVGQASGKILQYMAAGLPVICFDRENNRRYLGEAGYYVGEFTAEGLAKAILYFLENKDKIETMGAIALKRSEDFSWDIAADKIINVYKKD